MRANYKMQRLFVDIVLEHGVFFTPNKDQTHYLLNVLRIKKGQNVLFFNGKNGEWRANCIEAEKRKIVLKVEKQTRPQPHNKFELIYCFAPLKHARLDYMMQKTVEMGASFLHPVFTQHTQVKRFNAERSHSNIIEAVEQCGLLHLPKLQETSNLESLLNNWVNQWGEHTCLIFCDEAQIEQSDISADIEISSDNTSKSATNEHTKNLINSQNPLSKLLDFIAQKTNTPTRIGLLIGPEGGFSEEERKLLYSYSFVTSIPLGPRILRADTAAVAALTLIQATLGDW